MPRFEADRAIKQRQLFLLAAKLALRAAPNSPDVLNLALDMLGLLKRA